MYRSLCIPIVALCAFLQGEEPLSLEQELAHLIEKTNALETFHLIYDVESTAESRATIGSLEIVYRAPDFGRMRMSLPDTEVECWFLPERVYLLTEGKWQSAAFSGPSLADEVLDERFSPGASALEPGVSLVMALTRDARSGRTKFDLNLIQSARDRQFVLGWLGDMQRRSSEVSVEGDALAWNGDGFRCLVARDSGFLELVESSAEKEAALRLRECSFDEPLAPDLVVLPAEAEEAGIDSQMTRGFEAAARTATRRKGFLLVGRQLYVEERSWNERTRVDWCAFLDAWHRELIGKRYARPFEGIVKRSGELVEWVRLQISKDDSLERRAEIERTVAAHRAKIEEAFEQARVQYVESLPTIDLDVERHELFDLELEVIEELWGELVLEPTLAAFDEELEAALAE